ncbi:MAG: Smr/MutS family protein [Pseudooceanicola nanhaiensis]|uniref:Smr/MutS family protein n=1 Tax=Pseudooceanicola nanhaiensis TaxID=375761 RepID=UPI004059AA37
MSRKVRPDEAELWRKVARTTERMHPERKARMPEISQTAPRKAKPAPPPPEPLTDFAIGQSSRDRGGSHDLLRPIQDQLTGAPVRMDRKAHDKLKRGKLKPEARIDLHGMTQDRAHSALTGFVLRAHREDKRLVLVITGKGRDSDEGDIMPVRRGVLRHQVPHWLSVPPLSGIVLQVTPAHLRHGGGGAYYVYLRRHR